MKIPPPFEFSADIDRIAQEVAKAHRVSVADIMGKSRLLRHARARQTVQFMAYADGASYPKIAECFDTDHGTVMHNVHAVELRTGWVARPVLMFKSRRVPVVDFIHCPRRAA